MGGFEFLSWVAIGVAVGGVYSFAMRSQHFGILMPVLLGSLGGFAGGWLTLLLGPEQLRDSFRPGLMMVAFLGAGLLVLSYHLYRMSATARML